MSLTALAFATIIGSLIAAGTSAIGAGVNYNLQKQTNDANIQMQRETNAQNLYMSNTAHQREVQELKAAGLNPVLSATGGNGAPMASISSPKAVSPQLDLGGVSSAINGTVQSLVNLKMADMISQNYKQIAADKIANTTGVNQAKEAYYRDLANKLRAGADSSAINHIYSPKQSPKLSKKELKAIENMDWEELIGDK